MLAGDCQRFRHKHRLISLISLFLSSAYDFRDASPGCLCTSLAADGRIEQISRTETEATTEFQLTRPETVNCRRRQLVQSPHV